MQKVESAHAKNVLAYHEEPPSFSQPLWGLLCQCLEFSPEARPNMSQILDQLDCLKHSEDKIDLSGAADYV